MPSITKRFILMLTVLFLESSFAEKSIEINKSERKLRILENGKILSEYNCSLGKGGAGGKRKRGDNKTPEGEYRIVAINKKSGFHYFLHLSYPNIEDVERAKKSGIISDSIFKALKEDLKNGKTPAQTSALGGMVGIHGIRNGMGWVGGLHRKIDWTQGCIAVTNEEIEAITSKIQIGSKVSIKN